MGGDFVPDEQENIHYMFYDLISEELGPAIMVESDFPEHLQELFHGIDF